MAIYEYKCPKCKTLHNIMKPMKEAKKEERCPECDTTMNKVIGAAHSVWKCDGSYSRKSI